MGGNKDINKDTDKEIVIQFSVPVTEVTLPLLHLAAQQGLFLAEDRVEDEDFELGEVVCLRWRMVGDFNDTMPLIALFKYHLIDDKPFITVKEVDI